MAKKAAPAQNKRLHEACESVLSALLMEPAAHALIDLSPQDFIERTHREVYATIDSLIRTSVPVDGITVLDSLVKRKVVVPVELGYENWNNYIADLVGRLMSAVNIAAYAKIVREEGVVRRAKGVAAEFMEGAISSEDVDRVISDLMHITMTTTSKARRLSKDIPAFLDSLDQLQNGGRVGLTTGFSQLDHFLGGWIKSDLYLLAARSSVGKTAAMVNFSRSIMDRPHGIISTEQPARQLLQRYVALIGEVNASGVRLGRLEPQGWAKVDDAISAVAKAPIFIDDTAGISIDQLAKTARRWKHQEGIEMLFVDYAQRVRGSRHGRSDNRTAEVGEVARGLKDIGRELDIPVLALSQFNREADKRASGKPQLSDLRESGELEQEADAVIAVYRPSLLDDTVVDKRHTELIILKNRHGPLGYTDVEFYHEFMKFAEKPDYPRPQDFGLDGSK